MAGFESADAAIKAVRHHENITTDFNTMNRKDQLDFYNKLWKSDSTTTAIGRGAWEKDFGDLEIVFADVRDKSNGNLVHEVETIRVKSTNEDLYDSQALIAAKQEQKAREDAAVQVRAEGGREGSYAKTASENSGQTEADAQAKKNYDSCMDHMKVSESLICASETNYNPKTGKAM